MYINFYFEFQNNFNLMSCCLNFFKMIQTLLLEWIISLKEILSTTLAVLDIIHFIGLGLNTSELIDCDERYQQIYSKQRS